MELVRFRGQTESPIQDITVPLPKSTPVQSIRAFSHFRSVSCAVMHCHLQGNLL